MTNDQAKILPEAFSQRILSSHADGAELLAAISTEPWLSVRANAAKPGHEACLTLGDAVEWCADGNYLSQRPLFTLIPEFHAGAFYVQEASSMFLSHALASIVESVPPMPACLDLCAAPGGKTTLLLSRMAQKGGFVVANEVVRQRAWILRENVAKWGLPGAMVTNLMPDAIAASGARFDVVTVDAPCSGEGMFRKDDTAISEWSPTAAAECAERQRRILSDIWPALRPGGFLIYSTCTFNPDENENNMAWAIREFGAECIALQVNEWPSITKLPFDGGEGYAFYPHKVRGEGFFLCVLRKSEGDEVIPHSVPKRKRDKERADIIRTTDLGKGLTNGLTTYAMGEEVVGFPTAVASQMAEMAQALKPILAGTPIGTVASPKKEKQQDRGGKRGNSQPTLTPAPELPLSTAFNRDSLPSAEVDKHTALKFLHGDSDLQLPPGSDGWCAITYAGLGLGLVKRIGNRTNNYYPKEWRIRMEVKGVNG